MTNDATDNARPAGTPMKTCHFCFEPIRLEAIKCRFCGSMVSDTERAPDPVDVTTKNDQRVVYVLDKDLIRFGKFSMAILTLIIVVGALLYGIDIKQFRAEIKEESETVAKLADEMEAEHESVGALKDAILLIHNDMDASIEKVNDLQSEIEENAKAARDNARRAEDALAGILETQKRASLSFQSIVAMQDGSLTIHQVEATSTSETSAPHGKLWALGTTLHVRFLGGERVDHERIERWAKTWSEFANITFVFDNDPRAEIRISFNENGGSWSYVGRDNLDIPVNPDIATMNLGWVDKATVLRQFGHVLGLRNEHQNPYDPIPWNEEAVYEAFSGPPNHWTREMVYNNIMRPYDKNLYPIEKPFDAKSIMLFAFEDNLTLGDIPLVAGEDLSDGDKEFIAALYPKS